MSEIRLTIKLSQNRINKIETYCEVKFDKDTPILIAENELGTKDGSMEFTKLG
jgi:hypothetical protein